MSAERTAYAIACTSDRHIEYRGADGTCRLCVEVAAWPDPSPEQVETIRRCLPPLETALARARRSRTGRDTERRAA